MKNVRRYLTLLSLMYAVLGAGGVLCVIRFVLRLCAADELSPVGRTLVEVGGILTGPFERVFHLEAIGQLPGSTFETSALAGSMGFLLIALILALATGSWQGLRTRKVG